MKPNLFLQLLVTVAGPLFGFVLTRIRTISESVWVYFDTHPEVAKRIIGSMILLAMAAVLLIIIEINTVVTISR